MTTEELSKLWEKLSDDYLLEFEEIKHKRSKREDLHAFLLLDELQPGKNDLVNAAQHDVIYLDVNIKKLAEKITKEQIRELICCGVHYEEEFDSLAMFR